MKRILDFTADGSYQIGVMVEKHTGDISFNEDYPRSSPKGKLLLDKKITNTTELFQKNPFNYPSDVTYHVFSVNPTGQWNYMDSASFAPSLIPKGGLADEMMAMPQRSELQEKIETLSSEINTLRTQLISTEYEKRAFEEKVSQLQAMVNDFRQNGSAEVQAMRNMLEQERQDKRELNEEINAMRVEMTTKIQELMINLKEEQIQTAALKAQAEAKAKFDAALDDKHNEYQAKLDGLDDIKEERKSKTLDGLIGMATTLIANPAVGAAIGTLINKFAGGSNAPAPQTPMPQQTEQGGVPIQHIPSDPLDEIDGGNNVSL